MPDFVEPAVLIGLKALVKKNGDEFIGTIVQISESSVLLEKVTLREDDSIVFGFLVVRDYEYVLIGEIEQEGA